MSSEGSEEIRIGYIVVGVEEYVDPVIKTRHQEKLINFKGVVGPFDLASLEIKSLGLIYDHDETATSHHLGDVGGGLAGGRIAGRA